MEHVDDAPRLTRRRAWVAALLSLMAPGLGQFYNGELGKSIVFALGSFSLVALDLQGPLLGKGLQGVGVMLGIEVAYRLICVLEAGVKAHRNPAIRLARWNSIVCQIAFAFVFAYALRGFFTIFLTAETTRYRSFRIVASSMERTLQRGMTIISERYSASNLPQRGDMAVYKPPPRAESPSQFYVHRLIALPGDTISSRDEQVFINGRAVDEPYRYIDGPMPDDFLPLKLLPGQCFVMGDNRHNAADSRVFGPVPMENLLGRVSSIVWPMDQAQLFPHIEP